MPSYVHSDRASDFIRTQTREYLHNRGVATSKTSRYNPRGNGQAERFNGTIWKAVTLALKSKDLPLSSWECVLPDALHSIRSLLCTATNCTPHERMFSFQRKSTAGLRFIYTIAVPGCWLTVHQKPIPHVFKKVSCIFGLYVNSIIKISQVPFLQNCLE